MPQDMDGIPCIGCNAETQTHMHLCICTYVQFLIGFADKIKIDIRSESTETCSYPTEISKILVYTRVYIYHHPSPPKCP